MKNLGFTLVEILIAIAILGVISALTIPSYKAYTIRANRTDVQQAMQGIGQQLEAYKVNNGFSYTNATFSSSTLLTITSNTVATNSQYPASRPLYDLVLTVPEKTGDVAGSSWRLTATPRSSSVQNNSGIIVLNNQGWRCWTKTTAACTLSVTSGWDKGSST